MGGRVAATARRTRASPTSKPGAALPIQTPDGHPLLFEAYYAHETVLEAGSRLWRGFAPISPIGPLMLEVVQVPLARSLARRLGNSIARDTQPKTANEVTKPDQSETISRRT